MKITIHQPEHMPWLGFFHKIAQVDVCVLLDDVQYRARYFQSRNRVRTKDGFCWLTVPVYSSRESLINQVTIPDETRWIKKWHKTLENNYGKTKFGRLHINNLHEIIENNNNKLSYLNTELIKYLSNCLGIKTDFILSSSLNINVKSCEKVLNICKSLKADSYLSGISGIAGKKDGNISDFAKAGIKVEFQEFHHPIYKQRYEPFMPCMSVIDLLCNYGDESLDVIFGKNVEVMTELFE